MGRKFFLGRHKKGVHGDNSSSNTDGRGRSSVCTRPPRVLPSAPLPAPRCPLPRCLVVCRWPQASGDSQTRREGSTRQQAGARASRRQRARAAPPQHTLDLGAALQAAEQRAEQRRAAAAQRDEARKARRLARDMSASGGVAEQQALARE